MVVLGASLSGSAARGRRDGGWRTRVRDLAFLELGQPCARLRGSRAGAVVQPRQAGAALGPHGYFSPGSPSAPDRLARRSVNPGFRLGSHRESGLQRRWPLPGKTRGQHQKCTTNSAGIVLSINQRGGIDLDTLDAVALPPDFCLVGSLTGMGNRRRTQGDTRRRAHGCRRRCRADGRRRRRRACRVRLVTFVLPCVVHQPHCDARAVR